ncbi:MAG: YidC/Oxa1 family membrane protein insertase [Clostridia bacterium]|nr:YidC/Oxa1 family membrane protein insertase [Clostridia bacterium]
MIDAILKLFAYVVEFCYIIGGKHYLVGLILFAIIVKIAMLPLSIKQQKNSIKQATLRPKEMVIRKKYAGRNDQPTQQKMQNEIMELYQRENYNPAGGCLPLLIQLPILLGLYQVIIRPLEFLCHIPKDVVNAIKESDALKEIVSKTLEEGQTVEKVIKSMPQIRLVDIINNNFSDFSSQISEYVKSVEELPNFSVLGLNLADTPAINTITVLWLVPILTFVISFLSMKINKKFMYNPNEGVKTDAATGCSTKMMDWMMPLMSVYITFVVPAVIGIYWIFNNIFGTIQQIILAKVMPLPKFTEEDYKNVEKEMNGKSKVKKSSDGTGEKKKVRSLHRIDEDDYVAPQPEKNKKTEAPKNGLAGMIEVSEVQEDDTKKDE